MDVGEVGVLKGWSISRKKGLVEFKEGVWGY